MFFVCAIFALNKKCGRLLLMKNKTISIVYLSAGLCSLIYFIALISTDFAFYPSFSDCWLLLFLLCLAAFLIIHKRPANKKYIFLEQCKNKIRIAVKIIISIFLLIAAVNLFFICTPKVADGTVETEYLIMLGGGIKQDKTISATPLKRLEKSAEYLNNHPNTKVIVSGGQCNFSPCAEAPVLKYNLEKLGVDSNRIIMDDKAQDTIQNFIYSAQIIAEQKNISLKEVIEEPITIVTSRFHLRRSLRLAKRLGFKKVYGLASKTPALFVVNSYCREICSYIKLNLRILLTGKPESLAEEK